MPFEVPLVPDSLWQNERLFCPAGVFGKTVCLVLLNQVFRQVYGPVPAFGLAGND